MIRKEFYKMNLDQQMKHKQQDGLMNGKVARVERKIDGNGIDGALIPGIHNIQSVGTSPLRRGAKNLVQLQDRDGIFVASGGAGQVMSLVNKRYMLPAFERDGFIPVT